MPWPRERKCEAIRRGQQRSGNAASRKGASEQVAQASQRLSACRSRRTDADRLAVSATAPALLYLLHPCSRRQLLLRCSTSCIHAVVGNCSCVALPPASMQSSATAPALLYLLHPCSRRQPLLRCSTSCIHAVVSRQCTKELRADRRCLTNSFSEEKVAFRRPANRTARLAKATSLPFASQRNWQAF
jgi:hypothetical protein